MSRSWRRKTPHVPETSSTTGCYDDAWTPADSPTIAGRLDRHHPRRRAPELLGHRGMSPFTGRPCSFAHGMQIEAPVQRCDTALTGEDVFDIREVRHEAAEHAHGPRLPGDFRARGVAWCSRRVLAFEPSPDTCARAVCLSRPRVSTQAETCLELSCQHPNEGESMDTMMLIRQRRMREYPSPATSTRLLSGRWAHLLQDDDPISRWRISTGSGFPAPAQCQGRRRLRPLRGHGGRQSVDEGGGLPARDQDQHAIRFRPSWRAGSLDTWRGPRGFALSLRCPRESTTWSGITPRCSSSVIR